MEKNKSNKLLSTGFTKEELNKNVKEIDKFGIELLRKK